MQHDTFEIELRREPATMRLLLSGELDLAAQGPLRRLVELLVLQGTDRILVDTSDAEFIDASVVGTLFQLARQIHEQGGAISLVDAREAERPIWRLTGWSDLYPPLSSSPSATSRPA